jgi:bifunctional DNase/RNase
MAVPIPGEEDLGTDGFGTDATELHVDAAPVDLGAITEHQAEAVHASFVVMDVVDVSLLLPAQYPKVLLREAEAPFRALEFAVGLAEGTAIAQALNRTPTPRPLTHQLFANTLRAVSVDIVAVRLVGRVGSNYRAEVDLRANRGREVLDCRPSDALALALRQGVPAPILADERLLDTEGDVSAP